MGFFYILICRFSDFCLFLLRTIIDPLLITIRVIVCLMHELDGLVAERGAQGGRCAHFELFQAQTLVA